MTLEQPGLGSDPPNGSGQERGAIKIFSKSPRTRESKFGRERYGRLKLKCNRGHTIALIQAIVCLMVARTFWQLPYTQFFNPNSFRKKPFRPDTKPSRLRLQNGPYSI